MYNAIKSNNRTEKYGKELYYKVACMHTTHINKQTTYREIPRFLFFYFFKYMHVLCTIITGSSTDTYAITHNTQIHKTILAITALNIYSIYV